MGIHERTFNYAKSETRILFPVLGLTTKYSLIQTLPITKQKLKKGTKKETHIIV